MQSTNCKQLTPWKRILIEDQVVSQLAEKITEFFGPDVLIVAFANSLYPGPDESLPCPPMPLHSNITLPYHVCLPSGPLPLGCHINNLYPLLFPSHTCHMPRPSQIPYAITLNTIRPMSKNQEVPCYEVFSCFLSLPVTSKYLL
jgi:hypothetical protein